MLSDVLFDAIQEIHRYQQEMPDIYEKDRAEIEKVIEAMDTLRVYYDTPPSSLRR
jgi:hypothetical protein